MGSLRGSLWALGGCFIVGLRNISSFCCVHISFVKMGRALLSLLRVDGSTVLVWDLKLARELLGLPAFAAPLAPLGGVSGGTKVAVGSVEEKKKRKRKRHRKKKKKAEVCDEAMSCGGGSEDAIDDRWADSSPAIFGPLPRCDSASAGSSSLPMDVSKRQRLLADRRIDADNNDNVLNPRFASILKLQTRPDLVGQKVKLGTYDSERKRYGCEFVSGEKISVSDDNLMILYGVFAKDAADLFMR